MNLIATIALAVVLALTVKSRRTTFTIVTVVWAIALVPTAHWVLLVDQVDKRSMGNTVSFFVVNYLALALALGAAQLLYRRRARRSALAVASASV